MPLTEQQSAQIRVASQREARKMGGNYFLPILREPPFPTSFKLGQIVTYKLYMFMVEEKPIYLDKPDWEVIGYTQCNVGRGNSIVLHKDGQTISARESDIFIAH